MKWIYLLLLASSVAFVLGRGGREERTAVLLMLGSSVATAALYIVGGYRFRGAPLPFLAVEASVLLALLAIAFRSSRFWPLLYAALQIATVLSLLSPFFGRNLVSYALGIMQSLWAYPQLLILVLATVRRRTPRRAPA